MRAVLVAVGSRGDVAPFVALAGGLQSRGHQVTLISHAAHQHLIPAVVDFVAVASDPQELIEGPATQALRSGNLRALVEHRHSFAEFLTSFAGPTLETLDRAQVMVASTLAIPSVDLALQRRIPVVRAHTWPQTDSRFGPLPLVRHSWRLPGTARWVGHRAMEQAETYLAGVTGHWEGRRLVLTGTHPVTLAAHTHGSLHAYSATIAERPDPHAVVTGWWNSDDGSALSDRTSRILSSPGPWIAVGFGSMPHQSLERTLQVLDRALERAQAKAVVQTNRQDVSSGPRIHIIGEEPHSRLFEKVDAVIHHGGSGTTGAAVRAGVPSVMVPYFADQHYWAHRAYRVGVAVRPMGPADLRPEPLAQRLTEVLTPLMRRRAWRLAKVARAEAGVGQAINHLERVIGCQPTV